MKILYATKVGRTNQISYKIYRKKNILSTYACENRTIEDYYYATKFWVSTIKESEAQ